MNYGHTVVKADMQDIKYGNRAYNKVLFLERNKPIRPKQIGNKYSIKIKCSRGHSCILLFFKEEFLFQDQEFRPAV